MAVGSDERCRTLYAASWDETISIFDSLSYRRIGVLTGHTDTVSKVAVDKNHL